MVKRIGLIIILLCLTFSTALSEGYWEEIKVLFGQTTVEINGNNLNTRYVFMYKDKTYAPVRLVCEAMGGEVLWDQEQNRAVIKSYIDFPQCDYQNGEIFVYGLIKEIDYQSKIVKIEQHFDDNSIEVTPLLKANDDLVIIFQRNDKMMNLEFQDLKCGEDVGMVLDRERKIRGIIVTD